MVHTGGARRKEHGRGGLWQSMPAKHARGAPQLQACCNAASRAKRAIMLSGTPSLSRPFDLYRQVGGMERIDMDRIEQGLSLDLLQI